MNKLKTKIKSFQESTKLIKEIDYDVRNDLIKKETIEKVDFIIDSLVGHIKDESIICLIKFKKIMKNHEEIDIYSFDHIKTLLNQELKQVLIKYSEQITKLINLIESECHCASMVPSYTHYKKELEEAQEEINQLQKTINY